MCLTNWQLSMWTKCHGALAKKWGLCAGCQIVWCVKCSLRLSQNINQRKEFLIHLASFHFNNRCGYLYHQSCKAEGPSYLYLCPKLALILTPGISILLPYLYLLKVLFTLHSVCIRADLRTCRGANKTKRNKSPKGHISASTKTDHLLCGTQS